MIRPPKSISVVNVGHCRILVAFGKGLSVSFGLDFLQLLGKSGFSVYLVLSEAAKDWIGTHALLSLVRSRIFFQGSPPPFWVKEEVFDLGIIIGHEPGSQESISLVSELFHKCPKVLFLSSSCDLGNQRNPDFRLLPDNPGGFRKFYEGLYSEIVAFLHRKKHLGRFTFQISNSVPELLDNIEPIGAKLVMDITSEFEKSGFKPHSSDKAIPSVAIETFSGPFPVKQTRRKTWEMSFAPEYSPQIGGGVIKIRFFHHSLPEKELRKHVGDDTLICVLHPPGDLLVYSIEGDRMVPNLAARPAFSKFLEIIVDLLLHK